MRDGKGTLTSGNHSVYTGKFYQDKKHGKGEMQQGPDKEVYLEQWKYGVLVSRMPKEKKQNLDDLSMRSDPRTAMMNRTVIDTMRPGGSLLGDSSKILSLD